MNIRLSDLNWKTLVNMYYDSDKGMIQTYRVKNTLVTIENGVVIKMLNV